MESDMMCKCCICGREFTGWGNDPWPVVKEDDAVCCDTCNSICVIPARLKQMYYVKENDNE